MMATNDEKATPAATKEFVEYAGDPQYGTAFLTSHTITKGDPLWKRNGVEVDRDLVWERDPSVPVGHKSKMRLSTEGLSADAVKALVSLPEFKLVSE
jgi:hypothetical protein